MMKHCKYFLKTCVLLSLFVCVFAAPSVYAQGTPDGISQTFAIGPKVLYMRGLPTLGGGTYEAPGNIYSFGFNARFWITSGLGVEGGWARSISTEKAEEFGHKYSSKFNFDVIPVSALYTLRHVDTGKAYIRPYVGAGFNIANPKSLTVKVDGGDTYSYKLSGEDLHNVGWQAFAGTEFTYKGAPMLSFGFDLGIHNIFDSNIFGGSFYVNYYIR